MPEMVKLQTKVTTTRNLLDKMKSQLALALPKHLTADRLVRVVMTECLASVQRARPGAPTLLDCTAESFASAVLKAASVGLEPGPLDQVHLIPRRNTRRGTVECTFQIGYRGLMVLVRRSGQILTVDPVIVYARDRYEVRQGTTPGIRHEPYRPTDDPEVLRGPVGRVLCGRHDPRRRNPIPAYVAVGRGTPSGPVRRRARDRDAMGRPLRRDGVKNHPQGPM